MSWFRIRADEFGTKKKDRYQSETEIIPEVKRQRKELIHKSHSIWSVKKTRQKIDKLAESKILNIQNIIIKFGLTDKDINLLAAKCTLAKIFTDSFNAYTFIISHKKEIWGPDG